MDTDEVFAIDEQAGFAMIRAQRTRTYRDWVLAALALFKADRAWAQYDYERRRA